MHALADQDSCSFGYACPGEPRGGRPRVRRRQERQPPIEVFLHLADPGSRRRVREHEHGIAQGGHHHVGVLAAGAGADGGGLFRVLQGGVDLTGHEGAHPSPDEDAPGIEG